MKVQDVIVQLYKTLPFYNSKFTQSVNITDLTISSGVATVTTDIDHNLDPNDTCTIFGLHFPNSIVDITRNLDEFIATVEVSGSHDLTKDFQEKVVLRDTGEAEFDGEFELVDVIDSNKFIIKTLNDTALSASTGFLEEITGYNYNLINGYKSVISVPTTNSFTYSVGSLDGINITSIGEVFTGFRITGAVDFESAYDMYTQQADGEYWAFVVSDANTASKDRKTNSDAIYTNSSGSGYKQEINQNFFIYVFATTSNHMDAFLIKDEMQDIFVDLTKSIVGFKLNNGLITKDYFLTVFDSHVTQFYNKAIYAHSFSFQTTTNITDCDIFATSNDVALRRITFQEGVVFSDMEIKPDTQTLDGDINLP